MTEEFNWSNTGETIDKLGCIQALVKDNHVTLDLYRSDNNPYDHIDPQMAEDDRVRRFNK